MEGRSTDIGDQVQRLPVSRLLWLGALDPEASGSCCGGKLGPATLDLKVNAPGGI